MNGSSHAAGAEAGSPGIPSCGAHNGRKRMHFLRRVLSSVMRRRRGAEARTVAVERRPHDPAYVMQSVSGWRVCTSEGVLCHCFAAWYDECRLLPGGHAELRKRRPGHVDVSRFEWDSHGRAYAHARDFRLPR